MTTILKGKVSCFVVSAHTTSGEVLSLSQRGKNIPLIMPYTSPTLVDR